MLKYQSVQESWFHVVLGFLLSLTLFLPGEQVERSGIFHLPCILWLLTAVVWIILPPLKIGNLPGIRCTWIDLFVYVFFAAVCLSIGWNLLPGCGGSPRQSLNTLSAWLGLAAAWFLFRQLLQNEKAVPVILGIVLAVMLAQALLGLDQYFIGIPEILRQFEANPERTIAQIDPSIQPNTTDWDRLVSRLTTSGPMGTYPMTNSLGGLLGCWFLFLLGFIVLNYRKLQPGTNRFVPSLTLGAAVFIAGIILVCFVLTKCRSGIIAVGVGIVLLAFFQFRHRLGSKLIFAGCIIVALLAVSAFATSGKSLVSGAKRSLGFRLDYWQASLEMIRDYPLLGCGSGNFKQTYMKYKLPTASEEVSDPHNFAVEIAAASGIPALCLFLFIGITIVLKSRKCRRFSAETSGLQNARIFLGGFFGCVLAYFLSFNGEAGMDAHSLAFAVIAFPCAYGIFRKNGTEISSPLIIVTLLVLLVHLSAAGGISVTSTAVCLWLLLAILASRNDNAVADHLSVDRRSVRIPPAVLLGTVILLIAAIVFIQQTSLKSVLAANSLILLADEEPDGLRRIALLRQAAEADPWSSSMQERLATELFGYWQLQPDDSVRKSETLTVQHQAVRLMPRSATLYLVFAERLNLMYEKTGNSELCTAALEYYRNAVALYPNSAKFRAPFVLFLRKITGDSQEKREEALRQRDIAIKLDDMMPYYDQKLSPEQRQKLLDMN